MHTKGLKKRVKQKKTQKKRIMENEMYNLQTQSNLRSELGSMEGKTLKNGWKQYKKEQRKTQALSGKPERTWEGRPS